jgi:hypothetical protein
VAEFKYFGMTVMAENFIQKEIKWILNLGNACYHSVWNLLFYCLLSKNIKTGIRERLISPIVLYGYEPLSLTLREEQRLRLFENRLLRRIFRPN